MTSLPVACTLDHDALASRRALFARLTRSALATRETPAGMAWTFAPTPGRLLDLVALVDLERQCCQFLRFQITVPPGGDPLELELSGPEGTREFLRGMFEIDTG